MAASPSPARSSIHLPMDENRTTAALPLHRAGESRELTSTHPELTLANLVVVLVEAPRRRPRGARAIFVVDPAVARAHEQTCLREPAHWTAEVRAVDREELEPITLDVAHPARGVGCGTVPLHAHRVPVDGQASLALWKIRDRTNLDPRLAARAAHRRRDEPDHRNSHECRAHHVKRKTELEQEAASVRNGAIHTR